MDNFDVIYMINLMRYSAFWWQLQEVNFHFLFIPFVFTGGCEFVDFKV